MNLLADESVDRQIVERLRQDGYQVLYVAEMEPGVTDEIVLARANEQDALLITADKDFGELIFHQQLLASGGVVLIRLAGLTADRKAEIVSAAFHTHAAEFTPTFSVIAPNRVRIRPKV